MKISNPFKTLSPNERWAPTQSQIDAFQNAYEKLLPPLVYKIRLAVAKWNIGPVITCLKTSGKAMVPFVISRIFLTFSFRFR